MTLLLTSLVLRNAFDRLLCRLRAAKQARRAHATLARMTAHELGDIGLSHADALPAMRACCE